ncbi:MAG TPA: homoserine O-acetyltransferase [Gemmatimonadales bacterium]|nr:homoserine O-acetyltransferase [Gemmatimonadales bacterium]
MTVTSPTPGVARDFALGSFTTAAGEVLEDARLRFEVTGDIEAAEEHGWILAFHALTGNAHVADWWGPLVGPGRALDTTRHAIVSANLLGGCYGSTGPGEWPAGARPRFPALSSLDLARAHVPLLEHLAVTRLACVSGGSLGGMVALQWGRLSPVPVDRLVVFAAPAATSAQAIAWNATQRMVIEADPAWQGGRYPAGGGPAAGLAAARAIAMITYRSAPEFAARFGRERTRTAGRFDVEHYLRRQGEKLVARFDAASYVALMRAMDLHDVGDLAAAGRATAERVREIVGVGIDSDILYYPAEVRDWTAAYRAAGANARYTEIASVYGHDAFLIEWDQVAAALRPENSPARAPGSHGAADSAPSP